MARSSTKSSGRPPPRRFLIEELRLRDTDGQRGWSLPWARERIRVVCAPLAEVSTMPRPAQPSSLGLRRIDLLQGLSSARLDAISRSCVWRTCIAGQRLIAREDTDREVYFIVSGSVRVTTYSPNGRET